jgi:hypothetical protein
LDHRKKAAPARGGPKKSSADSRKVLDGAGGIAAYEPAPEERAAVEGYLATERKLPRLTLARGRGGPQISNDHPDPATGNILLMKSMGTSDPIFFEGLLKQLINAASHGREVDAEGTNFMLSIVTGITPRDQTEALLAAQMAAIHVATMTMTRRLAHAETRAEQDSAERALNKLARTFASQVEALKRYRTGGQQKVTVEHVTVNEGGQAIVGNIQQTNNALSGTAAPRSAPPALSDRSGAAFELKATASTRAKEAEGKR